jgi:hypothetical protein
MGFYTCHRCEQDFINTKGLDQHDWQTHAFGDVRELLKLFYKNLKTTAFDSFYEA